MSRPARALLDAQALHHNLQQAHRHAPRARIMAVVKANGYGHGLIWAAQSLDAADAFGVASVDEGLQLREAGITQPVCLLEGFFHADELPLLAQHQLETVVHHENQLRALENASISAPIPVWLKIDTGMHRLGFAPEIVPEMLVRLKACSAVGQIRLMSHLANADNTADTVTPVQTERFRSFTPGNESSLANSAGILAWPQTHLDWVRPGIMLYGSSPLADVSADRLDLQPVMTLQTGLIAVNRHRKGEAVGYGGEWVCPEDMPVGVAAIGYGDGYPRHAKQGTPVLVNQRRVPLIGRVSMDMITLDLRAQPEAKAGDPVVLWGEGLPVDEVASHSGTISYELLCHVTERIPRIAVKGESRS